MWSEKSGPSAYRLGGPPLNALLRAGKTRNDAPFGNNRFRTEQYALVYIASGTGSIIIDKVRYRLAPGDAFQRFPGITHADVMDTPSERYFIAVPREGYDLLMLTHALIDTPVLRPRLTAITKRFTAMIRTLARTPDEHVSYTLFDMLSFIADVHASARNARTPGGIPFETAAAMLSRDLDAQVSLPDIAKRLGINYNTFRKRFQGSAGMSPADFRLKKRMERAMEFLAEGMTVTAVAARLNYSDIYAFSAQFKRTVGVAPNAFRASQR